MDNSAYIDVDRESTIGYFAFTRRANADDGRLRSPFDVSIR